MSTKIILKKSSVAAKVPLATDLDYGELALNYADEKIYFKNSSNQIKEYPIGDVTIGTNQTITGNKTFSNPIISSVSTGTAPFTISSTTLVSNLNADLLDGQQGSYYAPINAPVFTGIPRAGSGYSIGADADLYLYESSSGNMGVRVGNSPDYKYFTFNSTGNFSILNGTLQVSSTTLVSNLNADLLDGQQGSYYLDQTNHTNKPAIWARSMMLMGA